MGGTKKRRKIWVKSFDKVSGTVPCYVCGKHVPFSESTIEHVVPKSLGGSNHDSNLSISHEVCNRRRANTKVSGMKLRCYFRTRRGNDRAYL